MLCTAPYSCLKNWQTGLDIWEELQSVASLEVISTCLMRIGMVTRKKSRGTLVFLNRLVWENVYTQVVNNPTRGNALLDVYLVWRESVFTSCSSVQVICDH